MKDTKTIMIFAIQDGEEVLRRRVTVWEGANIDKAYCNQLVPNYTRVETIR